MCNTRWYAYVYAHDQNTFQDKVYWSVHSNDILISNVLCVFHVYT